MQLTKDYLMWRYFVVDVPLDKDGNGPVEVGVDAASVTYEVWDKLDGLATVAVFDRLSDAIDFCVRMSWEDFESLDKD